MSPPKTIIFKYRDYKNSYYIIILILSFLAFLFGGYRPKSSSGIWSQTLKPTGLQNLGYALDFIFGYVFIELVLEALLHKSKFYINTLSYCIKKFLRPLLFYSLNIYALMIIFSKFSIFINTLFNNLWFLLTILIWLIHNYLNLLYLYSNDYLRFDINNRIIENNFIDYNFTNKKIIYNFDQIKKLEICGDAEIKKSEDRALISLSFNILINNDSFRYERDFHVSEVAHNNPSQELLFQIVLFNYLTTITNLEISFDTNITKEINRNPTFKNKLLELIKEKAIILLNNNKILLNNNKQNGVSE